MQLPNDLMQMSIAVLDGEGAVSHGVGLLTGLLEAIPPMAAPFVEPCERDAGVCTRIRRIELEGALKQGSRRLVRGKRAFAHLHKPMHSQRVGVAVRGFAPGFGERGFLQPRIECRCNSRNQLAFKRMKLARRHVEAFAPDLHGIAGVAQYRTKLNTPPTST